MVVKIIDPPGGWRYGFPKPLVEPYEEQLRQSGYPEKDIDFALRYSRMWEEDDQGS